jgi:TolB-like protein/Flp pilus assembly protein TadD
LYLFEDFALDSDRRELRRGSVVVPIAPQAFDLLEYLIRNRERVLSKDDLIASIWDGRIVSESALSTCINAARSAINDTGELQRLIRTIPRKGMRFVGSVREEHKPEALAGAGSEQPRLPLPDKPSIAVLPFQNMSGDPEQEHFADGTVEEIITALSRFSKLFVIARNSSFTYKGRAVDVKQVGRELGVRYVLEGSVRKAGARVRITSQLIDVSTGAHLWADRFDGSLADIFDLQDHIALGVVSAVTPKVEQAEIARAKRKPTDSLDAYEYFLRGMASFYQRSREAIDEALRLFYAAIGRDAEFASAYGMAAWCYGWRKVNAWTTDRAKEITETARLARRAAELGPDDAVALSRAAHALATVVGDVEDAVTFVDRALALNPNLAGAWWASGWTRVYRGEPETAIEHFARAMRLSPLDPHIVAMQAGTAFAHMLAGRYDEASCWAEKAMWAQNYLTPLRIAVASHALAGRLTDSRKALARLRELDPAASIASFVERAPLRRPEDLDRLESGLRRAGMPEN